MLNLSKCNIRSSATRDVASGVTSLEEGIGLIAARENGILKVKAAAGAANTDEFAGFALNERTAAALFPIVIEAQTVVLLESGKWGIRLPRPVVGTPRITYSSTGVALTLYTANGGTVLEAGEYQIDGLYLRTVEADLGKKLNVVYTYNPTVADLVMLGGDNSPTSFAPITSLIGASAVIEAGTVYTSNFDPAIDWSAWVPATGLKAVANGVITTGAGTGAVISGRVVEAPSADSPFLGIAFNVPA